MKKIILTTCFLISFVLLANASIPETNLRKRKDKSGYLSKSNKRMVAFYYILFEDGCFHLGYEQEEADGTYWIPCENDPSSKSNFKGMTFVFCPYSKSDMANIC